MPKEFPKIPVVVILGHIDHGKTSLLNYIKEKKIPERKLEITQHIGAFEVEVKGQKITFIDTPGHEAFFQMRQRGAKVADVAILVVDSVEGPKEQTLESIKEIEKAKIPFIVCATKVDKEGTDSQMVKQKLQKYGILLEDLGGEVPFVETSAKTGKGIDELLEIILLLAEMKDLKTNLEERTQGVIIESFLDPKRGNSATLILEEGILREGDLVATETTFGKARILENFEGKRMKEIFPGQAVLVIGFEELPIIGEKVFVLSTLEEARSFVKEKKEEKKVILFPEEGKKALNLILKTDVAGSLEAISEILKNLKTEEISINLVKTGVGEITISDLDLAKTAKAKILGFRAKISPLAKKKIEELKIPVFTFRVIYELIKFVEKTIEKMKKPEIKESELAKLKVLVDFWKEKSRQIVGVRVLEGEIEKGKRLKILRNEEEIGRGKILNLQKQRKDIEKAKKGEEIGILFEGEAKIEVGDTLICYDEVKQP